MFTDAVRQMFQSTDETERAVGGVGGFMQTSGVTRSEEAFLMSETVWVLHFFGKKWDTYSSLYRFVRYLQLVKILEP